MWMDRAKMFLSGKPRDQPHTTPNTDCLCSQGVTCIGFTDLPSRLPTQSSTLYSNNITKFLLSMGPFTTGKKGEFLIDHEDEAVRGALVLENGKMMWPAPPIKVGLVNQVF